MKKSILLAVLIAGALFLSGCEGSGTVQSGFGNADDTGIVSDNIDEAPDNGAIIDPLTGEPGDEVGDIPQFCADLGYTEVPLLIGCSQSSYLQCKCSDPTNVNQPVP